MAERCFIHITKVDEFKKWLHDIGWYEVATKGEYEVFRVWKNGRIVIFWKRNRTDHLSSYGTGTELSEQFLREKRMLQRKEVIR